MVRILSVILAVQFVLSALTARASEITDLRSLHEAVYCRQATGLCFRIVAKTTFVRTLLPKGVQAMFSLEDEHGAVAFYGDSRLLARIPRNGDVVELVGKTCRETFGAAIAEFDKLRLVCRSKPVVPLNASLPDLLKGLYDCRLVRVEGVVRDAFLSETNPSWTRILLKDGGCTIDVSVPITTESEARAVTAMTDSRVSVEGICLVAGNGPRRRSGRIFVCASFASVNRLADGRIRFEDVPDVSAIPLGLQPSGMAALGRHRATGTVIARWSEDNALLRTDSGDVVRVGFAAEALPSVGDRVDVAGFPESDFYSLHLSRSLWRPIGKAKTGDEEPLDLHLKSLYRDELGLPHMNLSCKYDIVRVRGRAIDGSNDIERNVLQLAEDGFSVRVDASSAPDALSGVEPGSVVSVVGVCVPDVEVWRPNLLVPRVRGFTVVVRKPDDVTILSRPPWWTKRRLWSLVGILFLIALSASVWCISLNALANRRGRALLRGQMEGVRARLKVVERTRLAVELHDSLSQNLAAVSMQLAAGRADVAARTVDACRNELRNCLWDLRSEALEAPDMQTAIEITLRPLADRSCFDIRFHVSRTHISDATAHAVLHIVRELSANAIRHGGASRVEIVGWIADQELKITIRDDGTGFDPSHHFGVAEGHFGLAGVRERVSRLGGRIEVESARGIGAVFSIHIPMPGRQGTA